MSPRPGNPSPIPFHRDGISLVEVMVAVVLLSIGATLMASALAKAMASVVGSRLDLVAAVTQRSRIELLRAIPGDRCLSPLRGVTEPAPGLSERWSASPSGAVLEVADTLARSGAVPTPLHILIARMPCQ